MKITTEHLGQLKKQYEKASEKYNTARVEEYDALRAAERAATKTQEARRVQNAMAELFKTASVHYLNGDDLSDVITKSFGLSE